MAGKARGRRAFHGKHAGPSRKRQASRPAVRPGREGSDESGGPLQGLIGLDHLAKPSFVRAVAAVAVRVETANEPRIAAPDRLEVRIFPKTEDGQRALLGPTEPRRRLRLTRPAEAAGDG